FGWGGYDPAHEGRMASWSMGWASTRNRKPDERTGAGQRGMGSGGARAGRDAEAGVSIAQALQTASLTDPGRVRDHNEDCIESRPEIGLFVLADGMGGYNAGEVASGMATSLIADGLEEAWKPADVQRLSREESKALSEKLIREQ